MAEKTATTGTVFDKFPLRDQAVVVTKTTKFLDLASFENFYRAFPAFSAFAKDSPTCFYKRAFMFRTVPLNAGRELISDKIRTFTFNGKDAFTDPDWKKLTTTRLRQKFKCLYYETIMLCLSASEATRVTGWSRVRSLEPTQQLRREMGLVRSLYSAQIIDGFGFEPRTGELGWDSQLIFNPVYNIYVVLYKTRFFVALCNDRRRKDHKVIFLTEDTFPPKPIDGVSWSPDGRCLAVYVETARKFRTTYDRGQVDLYVYDDSTLTFKSMLTSIIITNSELVGYNNCWMDDTSFLVDEYSATGKKSIMKIRIDHDKKEIYRVYDYIKNLVDFFKLQTCQAYVKDVHVSAAGGPVVCVGTCPEHCDMWTKMGHDKLLIRKKESISIVEFPATVQQLVYDGETVFGLCTVAINYINNLDGQTQITNVKFNASAEEEAACNRDCLRQFTSPPALSDNVERFEKTLLIKAFLFLYKIYQILYDLGTDSSVTSTEN